MSFIRRVVPLMTGLLFCASLAAAQTDSHLLPLAHHSGSGEWQLFQPAASTELPPVEVAGGSEREGVQLWHRFLVDPIYTSTGISTPAAMAFTGNWLNEPRHVEAVPLLGDGSEDWTYPGINYYADASRGADVLAAVDFNDADSTAVIREWRPGSATPLWSYEVHPCRSLGYEGWASRKPLQVSDDGSTLAAAIVMYTPSGQVGRLFVFAAGNGTPIIDWPFPQGNVVATAISAQGRYIAMAGWPTLYVFDRDAAALRWSGAIGSGNDALAISGDGNWLAWGWTTFQLREWSGSSYVVRWSHTPGGGLYTGQCALDNQESTLAVSWDNGNSFPNVVSLDLYELPSLDLIWSYDYQPVRVDPPAASLGATGRQHVDVPSQMLFSPDGQRLAVASWGDDFPELHVFGRSSPEPLYTLDTPGSLFDVDIADDGQGGSWVTACGKHVHAGTAGRGADLYAVAIPASGTAAGEAPSPGFALGLNHPNPFNPQTTLRFSLARSGPARLCIHDPSGRRVRTLLDRALPGGEHAIDWNGRDDAGRLLPSGVYLLRLEAGEDAASRKIVMSK